MFLRTESLVFRSYVCTLRPRLPGLCSRTSELQSCLGQPESNITESRPEASVRVAGTILTLIPSQLESPLTESQPCNCRIDEQMTITCNDDPCTRFGCAKSGVMQV